VRRRGRGSLAIVLFTLTSVVVVGGISVFWMLADRRGPLENLPDDGAFAPRRGSPGFPQEDLERMPSDAELKLGGLVAPDESLSEATILRLGETRPVGNLEVSPLEVEHATLMSWRADAPDEKIETGPVLVLRLRVKNVSAKQEFFPLDPAFLYPDPRKQMKSNDLFDGRGLTYTYLHPADRVADVVCPFDLNVRDGWVLEGQEFPKLPPGGQADLIVVSDADAMERVRGPMIWRVKLRKGLTATGQGVATVIGVAFDPAEIQNRLPKESG
jgi:hypothetical protein